MSLQTPDLRVSYAETNKIFDQTYQRVLVVAIMAALLACPLFGSDYLLHLFNLSLLAAIAAVGLNLLTGYCGQISLGHASFLAIGAFVTAILAQRYNAPFWL